MSEGGNIASKEERQHTSGVRGTTSESEDEYGREKETVKGWGNAE
tara:strand:- start:84 stop:218 length:135 start_codon:yes stop_codon:yes gene_type:complete